MRQGVRRQAAEATADRGDESLNTLDPRREGGPVIEPQPHPVGERGRDPLLTLSRAAAEMSRRPDQVPAIAVRTAVELGLDGVSFRVLEDDRMIHRSLEAAGSRIYRNRDFADAPSVERLIEALDGTERSS